MKFERGARRAGFLGTAEHESLDAAVRTPEDGVVADQLPDGLHVGSSASPRFRRSAAKVAARADRRARAGAGASGSAPDPLRRAYRRLRRAVTRSRLDDEALAALGEGMVIVGEIVDADRAQRVARMREVRERLRAVERQLAPEGGVDRRIGELARVTERLDQLLQRLDAEQQATPFVAPGTAVRSRSAAGREVLRLGAGDGSAYADFEDTYRGSEAFVADRLTSYLEIVTEGPVLDVGCGRGEFVGLMAAAGIPARGIDLDESMVDRARAKGLDVTYGDGLAELDAMRPGSLGAVTSFQVIEHIDVAALRGFFVAGHRALRPGGVMVAETVNPHSPAALKTFWLDITHVRPLFPESLLFLARDCGFDDAWIHLPLGTGDLDRDLRQCGEYALVAHKAAS